VSDDCIEELEDNLSRDAGDALEQEFALSEDRYLMARYLSHDKIIYDSQQKLKRISENPDSEDNPRSKRLERTWRKRMSDVCIEELEDIFYVFFNICFSF
jgi:hypothetical protein